MQSEFSNQTVDLKNDIDDAYAKAVDDEAIRDDVTVGLATFVSLNIDLQAIFDDSIRPYDAYRTKFCYGYAMIYFAIGIKRH